MAWYAIFNRNLLSQAKTLCKGLFLNFKAADKEIN